MGCCVEDSVRVSKMALELKSGPMLWYKRRFFGSNWRNVHCVLYNDSSLLWYKDRSLEEQEGGVILKDAPEMIAFGPYTAAVPDRPSLPDNYEQKQLLAFGQRGKEVVYWFLCPNEAEVASWMEAIATSMPAPQVPPQQFVPPMTSLPDVQQQQPHPIPTAQYVPPPQPPPQYTPQAQPVPTYGPPQSSPAIPGQYPARMSYRPPPYHGYNMVHPQPYTAPGAGAGGTTVVVQQDRQAGYIGNGGAGGGDFAMGMLVGGAIGTAWGSSLHHGHSVGYGHGWGGAWGGSSGPQVHDTDITINNYYDNDRTVVNNNLEMTNNISIDEQDEEAGEEGEVLLGDMMPMEEAGGVFDGDDFGADFGGF